MSELTATAAIIALLGILLTVAVLMTRTLDRVGVPVAILFLLLGMIGGSEGIGGLAFDDSELAFRVGTVALILILLDGGLNTQWETIRAAALPAGLLATFGVAATAAIMSCTARLFGLEWSEAILIGAIVSSTDAGSVFGVLRGGGVRLEPKLQSTLELESCANDPMAVILTISATEAVLTGKSMDASVLLEIPLQALVGMGMGLCCGFLFRYLLNLVRLSATGLYPVLVVAAAFSAFGASTLMYGSGFLAVFVSAVVIGNGHLPFDLGLRRVMDSFAWIAQVGMFVMLGFLVYPSRLLPLAGVGVGLGLVLAFLARPLATFMCLSWLKWPKRELGLVSWVGLRGAVPIILSTIPVMQGLAVGDHIFHIVFFVVVVSAILPGATIVFVALRSKLGRRVTAPQSALELNLARRFDKNMHQFVVTVDMPICGKTLRNIAIPEEAAIVMIIRADQPLPARGSTELQPEDVLYVVAPDRQLPAIRDIFAPLTT